MRTITLGISSREKINKAFLVSSKGMQEETRIDFESPRLLFKVLSGERWELLKIITGEGPLSITEVGIRLDRDEKALNRDVQLLLNVGILQKNKKGQIEFPYEAVHVDFMLKAA